MSPTTEIQLDKVIDMTVHFEFSINLAKPENDLRLVVRNRLQLLVPGHRFQVQIYTSLNTEDLKHKNKVLASKRNFLYKTSST